MRFGILIVLWVGIALLVIDASSFYDSVGKSVDQLINESRGIYIHSSGTAGNPQEARDLWSKEANATSRTSPDQSQEPAPEEAEADSQQSASTAQAELDRNPPGEFTSPAAVSAQGNWSFELRDSKIRMLYLSLHQSNGVVFGNGSMNDGTETQETSASGSIQGDKMTLDVISAGTTNLYRMALTMSTGSAEGEYVAYSSGQETWKGMAKGLRIE